MFLDWRLYLAALLWLTYGMTRFRRHDYHRHRHHHRLPEKPNPIHHVFLIQGECDMAQAFAVPFAATTDPSCAKRVFTATASEAAPFSVECASAAGGVVNSAALTGTYAAGATFDATVTAYNVLGEAGPATACTVTIVGTPAAADPISKVGLVTV